MQGRAEEGPCRRPEPAQPAACGDREAAVSPVTWGHVPLTHPEHTHPRDVSPQRPPGRTIAHRGSHQASAPGSPRPITALPGGPLLPGSLTPLPCWDPHLPTPAGHSPGALTGPRPRPLAHPPPSGSHGANSAALLEPGALRGPRIQGSSNSWVRNTWRAGPIDFPFSGPGGGRSLAPHMVPTRWSQNH